jgi:sulfite oxidase
MKASKTSQALSRRAALRKGLAVAGGAALLPSGLGALLWARPETARAAAPTIDLLKDKPGLRLLGDRPLNAETPAHLLNDFVTPASKLFVRNNGVPPVNTDPANWMLEIAGEACERPQRFSIDDLKARFEVVTRHLVLECGGNGRSEFRPRVSGNQWTTGAVGCPRWTGVRLADVLKACGVAPTAVYVGYESADTHLSGDPKKQPISRGVPIEKALEDDCLLAFEMNGAPIPDVHGAPLRLLAPGYPGSASGKWLTTLLIRDRVHDGAKMTGSSYRVPCEPVAPGTKVPDEAMCIIEAMPVKSLITAPRSGLSLKAGEALIIEGHAWSGAGTIAEVALSADFGASWQTARLGAAENRFGWQRFEQTVTLPGPGYYEIWARATDEAGATQPMLVPGWNPKGYLNNAAHRIAVEVLA